MKSNSKLLSAPYSVWVTIFIVLPMLLVAWFAFTDGEGRFTLENILSVGQYSNVFLRSIWLGALATAISLVLGYPLAYIIAKMAPKRQSVMVMLVMLPMWTNFLLRTYAWMTLLEDNGLINAALSAIGLPRVHMINTAGAVAGEIQFFLDGEVIGRSYLVFSGDVPVQRRPGVLDWLKRFWGMEEQATFLRM